MEKRIENKYDYLKKLKELLKTLPEIERQNALKYYEEYFNEAGEENEMAVIEELGDVELLASQIKETNTFKEDKKINMSISEKSTNNALMILILIAILVFGIPVVFPVLIGMIATAFGIACVGIAIGFAGIVCFAFSIPMLFTDFFAGILVLGISLILVSLGIVFTVTIGWLIIKILPICVRWFVNLCRKAIGRGDE